MDFQEQKFKIEDILQPRLSLNAYSYASMVPEHPETFKEFMDKSKNKKVKNSIIHCFYEENEVNIEKMIHDVFEKAVNLNQFRLFIRMVQKEIILETDFRSFIEHCIF